MAPIDPRTITPEQIGTRLRDAAVNPRETDFLPPTNAGEAGPMGNPHGPTVVSPEIHGSESNRPILPGPVSDDGPTQSTEETAGLQASLPGTIGVVSIALTGTATVVAGETTDLVATATLLNEDTQVVTDEATWTSSDPTKATVVGGVVTGVAEGTADIVASFGDVDSSPRTVVVTEA